VRAGRVGEVMPGTEHRAVAGQHDAQRIAVPELAERRDQLAHVLQGQRVAALRPVHRHGGEVAGALHQDVLKTHNTKVNPEGSRGEGGVRWPAVRRKCSSTTPRPWARVTWTESSTTTPTTPSSSPRPASRAARKASARGSPSCWPTC